MTEITAAKITPTLSGMRRHRGLAGQFGLQVTVTYPEEEPRVVEFVGSSYGGPVLMVTDTDQVFVTDPRRFGEFGKDWVRRFFS
jgi:hypothetical protein